MDDRILRMDDLVDRLGVSRASLYAWMKSGRFPRPIKIGFRAVGWKASTVSEWVSSMEDHPVCPDGRG